MMKMNKREIANRKLGLYFHIPFCKERCSYCDFLTFPHVEAYHSPYIDSLIGEIRLWSQKLKDRNYLIDSLYIGGGTPTIISDADLKRLFKAIRAGFTISEDAEWTIEANPGTLSESKLDIFQEAGVNRISLGVQTMSEKLIDFCKRDQTPDGVYKDVELVRSRNYFDLNLDFIFSIPGQTHEDLDMDLRAIGKMDPDHVSYYSLIIEDRTLLKFWIEKGKVAPNPESREVELMTGAYKGLEDLGYKRYEISNFSKRGKESRHNLKYWSLDEYLGLGLGAASYMNHERFSNTRNIQKYIESIAQDGLPFSIEKRNRDDDIFEGLMMGFRKISGIDRRRFKDLMGEDPLERAGAYFNVEKERGLVEWDDDRVRLTKKGLDLQNSFLSGLMEYFDIFI